MANKASARSRTLTDDVRPPDNGLTLGVGSVPLEDISLRNGGDASIVAARIPKLSAGLSQANAVDSLPRYVVLEAMVCPGLWVADRPVADAG